MWQLFKDISKEIGIKGYIWFACLLGLAGWGIHYNWLKNYPERLSDPLNWIFMVVFIGLYLFGRKIKII